MSAIPDDWAIASEIRAMRKQLDMEQAEFAATLKVSRATISNWENAKSQPTAGQFRRMQELRDDHLRRYLEPLPMPLGQMVFFEGETWPESGRPVVTLVTES